MPRANPKSSFQCGTDVQKIEKWSWFDGRATASEHAVFSIVVAGLWSLMDSMSIAFSPLTASIFGIYDESFWNCALHFPTKSFSVDHGPISSFGYISATSEDTSEESAEECIQNVTTNLNNNHTKRDPFSATIATIRNITVTTIQRIPISKVAFRRKLQKSSKIIRNDHSFAISEIFVPIKMPRLDASNDQNFRKRKKTSNTSWEMEMNDEDNETVERKKARRMLGRQIRKNERKGRQWEAMFQLLLQYKTEHAHTLVPINYVKHNKDLGKWVATQRISYKTGNLSDLRIQILGSIGFPWCIEKPTKEWMKFYKSLIAYKENHNGSTMVPRHYPKKKRLGFWVHQQRIKYRKNQLSTFQVDLLDSIGFTWDIRVE